MKKTLIVLAVASILTACGGSDHSDVPRIGTEQVAQPQDAPAGAPAPTGAAPVVVQQKDSGVGDMLLGGAIGYMLGSSGNRQAAPAPQIIERQVVREVPREPARSSWFKPSTPKPAVVASKVEPPKVVAAPAPAPAPKPAPSYSSNAYKAPTSNYKPSVPSPSRSYSAPSRSYSSPSRR